MKDTKFTAPQNQYVTNMIQSAQDGQPKDEKVKLNKNGERIERIGAVLLKVEVDYLNEMSYRSRMNLTQYLSKIIREDMEKHPNWKENLNDGK